MRQLFGRDDLSLVIRAALLFGVIIAAAAVAGLAVRVFLWAAGLR